MPITLRRPFAAGLMLLALLTVLISSRSPAPAFAIASPLIISEVAPWSSGNSPVAADWFEVTNTGSSAVDITGWKMDDNSNAFGSAVPLGGITSIAAGESVIFIETSDLPGTSAAFISNWFGTNPPVGLQIGSYSGSGVGLSTGGDAVNLFDSTGVLQANVTFGASPGSAPFASFDNASGLNNTAISQLSAVGVHGAFVAANDASEIGSPGTVGKLFISEVAPWSSGNSSLAADWFEVTNTTAQAVDVTGWKMDDNSNAFGSAVPMSGITSIASGESVIFIETSSLATLAQNFKTLWFGANPPAGLQIGAYSGSGVGLGTGGDAVNLYNSTGVLQANVSFGSSPGSAPFATFDNAAGLNNATISQLSSVGVNGAFAAANDADEIGSPGTITTPVSAPLASVVINEVESSGGTPADWVELYNTGATSADLSGYILRDSLETDTYAIPASTTLAAGAFLVLDQAQFGFDLDSADSARLFAPNGTTLIDSYTWATDATTTYGRCPDGSGAFTTTTSATKGAANACPGAINAETWPGDAEVQTVDGVDVFGTNLSGLTYEGTGTTTPGVLWAVRNGPSTLFRLLWNGTIWTPDTTNGWSAGKTLLYTDGNGAPDSEGVTYGATVSAGMYVSTERNNDANTVSRLSVLRYDVTGTDTNLTATNDWNLTADLPPVGANLGLEAITYIPDAYLTSQSFFDEGKGHTYLPSDYPLHGDGLFFIGVEGTGMVYAYVLNSDNSFAKVATITSGFPSVMDLAFDRELHILWVVCDNTCNGRTETFAISGGHFAITHLYERPGDMPDINNEGFTFAPLSECVDSRRPAYWSDDDDDNGHAIRRGDLTCDSGGSTPTPTPTGTPVTVTPTATPTLTPTPSSTPATGTPTPTLTPIGTATPTATSTPPTGTPTLTPTGTLQPTATATATLTTTPGATATWTPSPTRTPTATRTPTSTRTPTQTRTPSPTRTATLTRTPSPTPTQSPVLTATPTRTPSPTPSMTPTRTPSPTPTVTPTPIPPSPDVNGDGTVGVDDLLSVLIGAIFDPNNLQRDVNHDGRVDFADVFVVLFNLGKHV